MKKMENQELRTYSLSIKEREGKIEVKAKDQTRALIKILAKYPELRKLDRDYLLENLGVWTR